MALELTKTTIDNILISPDHRSLYPTYKQGEGPIAITVVDPLKIPKGDFLFKLMNPTLTNAGAVISYGRWELLDADDGSIINYANEDIIFGSEQYITSLGLNVKISQTESPGSNPNNIPDNGLISGTIQFDDINDRWLSGVADRDDESEFFSIWGFNWIRAGSFENTASALLSDYSTDDPNGAFEGAVVQTNIASSQFGSFEWSGGTWAPYRFASYFNDGPGIQSSITNLAKLENLNSVDIYIFNDKAVNAFVACGQKVFINTGLIQSFEDPSMLRGVLAHETGHIAGGHLARSDKAMEKAQTPMIVGLLLGIGAAIAGESDAAQALLLGSQQIAKGMVAKYSRGQESAADQAAFHYLEKNLVLEQ